MRAYEFITELKNPYDIGLEQAELARQFLSKTPKLFESNDNFKQLTNLLSDFKVDPEIGEKYLPISITSVPIAKYMTIAKSSRLGKLTKITDHNVFFDFGQGERPYPYNNAKEDMLQETLLCKTIEDQEKVMMWIELNFGGDWRVNIQ
jgi:hypothetical protein